MIQAGIEPRFYRDVGERPVPVVVVERAVVQAGDEQVGMPVVVIIGDGHSHVVARSGQARGVGDIGEHAVAIVAEETVAILGDRLSSAWRCWRHW